MWPRGSSQWNVQVLEETFQRVALENRLKGATNRLEKSSDEKHRWHSAEPVWQSGSYFGAYISCGFWHSGTGFGDCVRLRNHTLPCNFFQCYSERTILTALFWILHLGIYGGIRWMRLCPVGRIETIFSWTLTAGMGVITGVAYTPLFLLPSISILPMDPNGGQTGLFCILHLKDLSTNDLSAV